MRGIAAASKELIATVNAILEEDHPQTLRQLHYRIFSLGMKGSADRRPSMNAKAVQVKTRDCPDAGEMEGLKLLLAPTNCRELVHVWWNRQRVPDVREMAS